MPSQPKPISFGEIFMVALFAVAGVGLLWTVAYLTGWADYPPPFPRRRH